MHPAIQILCIFELILFYSKAQLWFTVLGLLLSVILVSTLSSSSRSKAFSMIFKLKWLYLSLLVVYGWYTPGTLLVSGYDSFWNPSIEGLFHAIERILILVNIICLVAWLVSSHSSDALLSGLYWLFKPLSSLGLKLESLILRFSLTVEYLSRVPQLWKSTCVEEPVQKNKIQYIQSRVSQAYQNVLHEIDHTELRPITITLLSAPPVLQWGYPVLIVILGVAVLLISG